MAAWVSILVLTGAFAGITSTTVGVGGGFLAVVILSIFMDPVEALALSSPAVLAGNLHRVALYGKDVDRAAAVRFIVGALPGALIGGLAAVALPSTMLRALLVVAALLGVAQATGWLRIRPGQRGMVAGGFGSGFLTATSGASAFVAPTLLAGGVRGNAFVATAALGLSTIHLTRMVMYGTGGLLTADLMLGSALLTLAVLTGNLVGRSLRARLPSDFTHRLSYGVLVPLFALAVVGMHH